MTRTVDYYDHAATDYDALLTSASDQRTRASFHGFCASSLPASGRVLDFGCGTGLDIDWLLARGNTVLAFDPSAGMMTRLATRHERAIGEGRVQTWLASFEEFARDPAQHGPCCAAISNFAAFNHVDDLRRGFAALKCVVDGPIFLGVLNPYYPRDVRSPRWWWRTVRTAATGFSDFGESGVPVRRYRRAFIARAAAPHFRLAAPVAFDASRQFMFIKLV